MHCFVLLFVDVVLIGASTLVAIVLCSTDMPVAVTAALHHGALTIAAAVPVLWLFGLNRSVWRFTSLRDAILVAAAVVTIVALVLSLESIFQSIPAIPRMLIVLQGLLMLYSLAGARVAMRIRHDQRRARKLRPDLARKRDNVLIVGLSPLTDLFLHCAARNGQGRIDIVGILSNSDRHRGRRLRSCKILGPSEAIEETLHDLAVHGVFVDRIVVTCSSKELPDEARSALRKLEQGGNIRIDRLSRFYGLSDSDPNMADQATDHPLDAVEHRGNSYLRWKRLLDASVALAFAGVFAPLMIFILVAVLIDVGWPAIFWQQRPGAGGRPIKVLKFRTMGPARDGDGRALSDAERVSRLGNWLRRLRFDELPQVYNVLLGHMSLVGPRPLLPVDQPSAPAARLSLRPGLTGWAQIKGGRQISSEDKAALDLWYIKNASFSLDMKILVHTVRMILFGERIDKRAIHEAWQALRHDSTIIPLEMAEQNPV